MEASSPELAAALRSLSAEPTADHHRRVAWAYYRAGVLDVAFEHFAEAARIDPRDGWALEGMARVWRDWGTPGLGLGDAHRAVNRLPAAPEARNTLGTILFALGRLVEARHEFEEALRLAPGAVYALDNLCYLEITEGRSGEALAACTRALAAAPGRAGARNNLALARALCGDIDAAARELASSGKPAGSLYNRGILYLAARRYEEAAEAFADAARLDPALPFVAERARQARVLAEASRDRR